MSRATRGRLGGTKIWSDASTKDGQMSGDQKTENNSRNAPDAEDSGKRKSSTSIAFSAIISTVHA
jgi:hypothetical protein